MKTICLLVLFVVLVSVTDSALAQITPSKQSLADVYPGKAYSPYAQRNFPSEVFWGDTHLHTGLSVDAGLFGARLGLDEAYRFARGEEVMASSGQPAKLGRPLDWLVIGRRLITHRWDRFASNSAAYSPLGERRFAANSGHCNV